MAKPKTCDQCGAKFGGEDAAEALDMHMIAFHPTGDESEEELEEAVEAEEEAAKEEIHEEPQPGDPGTADNPEPEDDKGVNVTEATKAAAKAPAKESKA